MELAVDSKRCHAEIDQLLARTVLSGGKRLRPLLTHLFGRYFALSIEQVRPYASCIEMVHAATLAHDDVIDQASIRRGEASINALSSNKKAVLAGDYLLSEAIVILTERGPMRLASEMGKTIQYLTLGEWLQLDASLDRDYDFERIKKIAALKTSSVMSWCAKAPAILSNSSESLISICDQFGHHLGLAFQMSDDCLDFSRDSKKDQHLDLLSGVLNSVLFFWLEENPHLNEEYRAGADLKTLYFNHIEKVPLDSAIKKVSSLVGEHLKKCHELLAQIDRGIAEHEEKMSAQKNLAQLIDYLATRLY